MKNLLLGLFVFMIGCTPPSQKRDELLGGKEKKVADKGYILAISEVDNAVKVFMNDSLIFSSGTIHSSPEVDYQIDLTPMIKDGSEVLRVELWNGVEPYEPQIDPIWEIRYDLVINGEIVDFIHEYDDDNTIGKAYENSYVISEWVEKKLN